VDRKALALAPPAAPAESVPSPEIRPADAASDGDLPRRILEIWRELLGNPVLGGDDKLFEHGAHSFHAVEANLRINRELAAPCTVTDIFEFATVNGLAAALRARMAPPAPTLPSVAVAPAAPTDGRSSARVQRRRQYRTAHAMQAADATGGEAGAPPAVRA
jgi:hypothetical protein